MATNLIVNHNDSHNVLFIEHIRQNIWDINDSKDKGTYTVVYEKPAPYVFDNNKMTLLYNGSIPDGNLKALVGKLNYTNRPENATVTVTNGLTGIYAYPGNANDLTITHANSDGTVTIGFHNESRTLAPGEKYTEGVKSHGQFYDQGKVYEGNQIQKEEIVNHGFVKIMTNMAVNK